MRCDAIGEELKRQELEQKDEQLDGHLHTEGAEQWREEQEHSAHRRRQRQFDFQSRRLSLHVDAEVQHRRPVVGRPRRRRRPTHAPTVITEIFRIREHRHAVRLESDELLQHVRLNAEAALVQVVREVGEIRIVAVSLHGKVDVGADVAVLGGFDLSHLESVSVSQRRVEAEQLTGLSHVND